MCPPFVDVSLQPRDVPLKERVGGHGKRTETTAPSISLVPPGSTVSVSSAPALTPQRSHEEDRSSIELVDLEPSELWELDRVRGIPLSERVKRHRKRTEATPISGPPVPHRTRLASQPTVSRGPGSQARFLASQLSLRIPESHGRYEDGRNQDNSDLSTPPTPKHHRMPSIPGSPSRFFHDHNRSLAPQPSSHVTSLLRDSGPFLKNPRSLLNLSSSQHGTPQRMWTKLFHRKTKERASDENMEDWEVLERTGSGESTIGGSLPPPSPPPTPQNKYTRQLPRLTAPDVFVRPPTKLPADRSRKANTVQLPPMGGSEVLQPAPPPFVARHVRRHTTSSRGSQMSTSSAPASPISVSSTSTFSTSTISLSQNAIAAENVLDVIRALANFEITPETPRAIESRDYESSSLTSRTPQVSSPAPVYKHDPDSSITPNPAPGPFPIRSATRRTVLPPDVVDEGLGLVRETSLSKDMSARSTPANHSIFSSRPSTPLPDVTQSFPPTTQPSPPDLTLYIVKTYDQYLAGGGFGDVYRCWCRDDSTQQEV